MDNKSTTKNIWKIWPGFSNHGWKLTEPKNIELALKYRQVKKICRKCHSKLPQNATKCRNKKCHCTDLRYAHDYSMRHRQFYNDTFYIPDKKIKELKNVKNIDEQSSFNLI